MRQSPNTSQHVVDAVTNHLSYGATHSHVFPHELDCFDSYTLPGQDQPIKDLDTGRHQKRRKAHQKERLQITKSEDIPNYMGNKPIDNIIDFIENNKIKKPKKANHPAAVSANALPNTNGKNDSKTDKKCKDKKQKNCMQNCCVSNDVELVNSSIERTTNIVNITDAGTKKTELHCIMGNSSNKLISDKHDIMVDLPADGTIPVECAKYEPTNGDSDAVTSKDSQTISIECGKQENVHIKIDGEEHSIIIENQSISGFTAHPMGADEASLNDVNPLLTEDVDKTSAPSIDIMASATPAEVGEVHSFNDLNPSVVVDTGISVVPFDIADFIYTDVDVMAPIEPEFTVVGKKKKPRPIVRDNNRQAFIPRNNFRGDRKFVNNKHLRSVTPPPPQSMPAKLSIEKERTQDLSPNAFPALENKASPKCRTPSLHEGRRNSTGDVPTDQSMKCQDDSDLESVKSLPAQGELLDPLSPGVHHVHLSYARIAASPRSSSSNASAASSSTCNNHLSASRSHTEQFTPPSSPKSLNVWKGSPTERRHSLGASPDGSKGDNLQSITKSLRQKSGSQELPKLDDPIDDPAVDTLKSPACKQLQSEVITCPSSSVEVGSTGASSSAQSFVCEETLGALGTRVNNVKMGNTAFIKAKPVTNSISTVSSSSTVQQQYSPSVKGANNNHGKRYKPQSVIFLDNKRDSNLPQNLGISFGFEDSDNIPSINVNNKLNGPAVKDDSMNNLSNSGITSHPSSVMSSTSPTPKTMSKDICIPPVNGLVQHKLSVQDVRNCQFNSSDITFFASDPDGAQTANPKGDNNCQIPSKLNNHVIVNYGEAIVPNVGCCKPGGQLIFRVEVNNQGNFNVQQAASFLKKGKFDM